MLLNHKSGGREDPCFVPTLFSVRAKHQPPLYYYQPGNQQHRFSLSDNNKSKMNKETDAFEISGLKYASYMDEKSTDFFKMDDIDVLKRRTTTIIEEDSRRPSIVYEEDMPVIVRRRGVTMTVR